MIRSFRCRETRRLFEGECPKKWHFIQAQAERKLEMLDAAASIDFLRSPPGNRLEQLKGDRKGQWSIRINDQWRLCFVWNDGGAEEVEIVDYH